MAFVPEPAKWYTYNGTIYHLDGLNTKKFTPVEPQGGKNMTEPQIEKNVRPEDIKVGDEVTVRHSGKVTSVNTQTGHVRLSTGARVRISQGKGFDRVMEGTVYTVDRTKKAIPAADFKVGQVWQDPTGESYFVMGGVKPAAYTKTGVLWTLDKLANKPGLKLVGSF